MLLGVVQREEKAEVLKTKLLMEAVLGNAEGARETFNEYLEARLPFTEKDTKAIEQLKEDTLRELDGLEVKMDLSAFTGKIGELPDQKEAWEKFRREVEEHNKAEGRK